MKTKLTLDQLRTEDFFEIIEKDELESLIGQGPQNSCVFNCFDYLDGDAHKWQYYARQTHRHLGYWAGSNGGVNTCDIATIGSYGDMLVMEANGNDSIAVGGDGSVTINGTRYSHGIITFQAMDGSDKIGHAVVVLGTMIRDDGAVCILYHDPSAPAGQDRGYIVGTDYLSIYGVGQVGSYSNAGSLGYY